MTRALTNIIYILIFFFSYLATFAQNKKIDSLLFVLKSAKEDTNKVNILNALSTNLCVTNADSALPLANEALKLAQKIGSQKGIGEAYHSISNCYSVKPNIEKQIEFLLKELKVDEEIDDKNKIIRCYRDLGSVYRSQPNKCNTSVEYFMKSIQILNELLEKVKQKNVPDEIKDIKKKIARTYSIIGVTEWESGQYSNAITHHLICLKIWEELKDNRGIANSYNNIGIVYDALGNFEKAIEYHKLSLKYRKIFLEQERKNLSSNDIDNSKNGEANSYNNLGVVYEKQGNLFILKKDSINAMLQFDAALENFNQALKLFEETKNASGIPMSYDNIGNIYSDKKLYDKAMEYLSKALSLREEKACGNCKLDYSATLISIGSLNFKQNKPKEALARLSEALAISKEMGSKENIKNCSELLAKVYYSLGDYKMAYHYFEKYNNMKDSLLNEESYKQVAEMSAKYETDKKEIQIKLLEKDNEKQDIESKKQRIITYAISGGLCLVILLALFILRGYKQKKKAHLIISRQKQEVENKKQIIEEKNKDITDSINYAKRIQQSKLPKIEEIQSSFSQSFILFKPKDIVSGDFYFFKRDSQTVFIAAADSTGHGVPGALMSMIGSEKLEDAVTKKTNTSDILNQLNKSIKTALHQYEESESARDGMDIALCKVNLENKLLTYAGANRPFWLIRNGSNKLEEIKATKKAIGGLTEDNQYFNSHEFELVSGDTFYLCTDGFADQFGGEHGKKLMNKTFKEILIEIQNKTMPEQEKHLNNFIEKWRAGSEQVDDILVIGIRL